MSKFKEQQIIGELLNSGLHYLREMNVPIVILLPNNQTVCVNIDERHAHALIEDAANFKAALRDKRNDAKIERIVDSEYGKGE